MKWLIDNGFKDSTGVSLCTHTSLLPPPFCRLTTKLSADRVTRVRPPCMAAYPSGPAVR